MNKQLSWTNQQILKFSKQVGYQIDNNQYHRNSTTDLRIITELKLLSQILRIKIWFKTLTKLTITELKNLDDNSDFNKLQLTITDQVKQFNNDNPGDLMHLKSADSYIGKKILRIILNLYRAKIDQNLTSDKLISQLNNNVKWQYTYKNLHVASFYHYNKRPIKFWTSMYKINMLGYQKLIINSVLIAQLKTQSIPINQASLRLLFDLKLLNPEILMSYYNYYVNQYAKKYAVTNSDKFYEISIDYLCYFNAGLNQYYYQDLILSKFLRTQLHCQRRRPFSINFYLNLLILILEKRK